MTSPAMAELFGELRALLDARPRRGRRLRRLLQAARAQNPARYDEVWIPYLEEHASWWEGPVDVVTTRAELEEFAALVPFGHVAFGPSYSSPAHVIGLIDDWMREHVRALHLHDWEYSDTSQEPPYVCTASDVLDVVEVFEDIRSLSVEVPKVVHTLDWERRPITYHTGFERGDIVRLTKLPGLKHLERFRFSCQQNNQEDMRHLWFSDWWRQLRHLDLSDNGLGPNAVTGHFLAGYRMPKLRELILSDNPKLGDKGARNLARRKELPALERVVLKRCGVTEAGAQALRASAHFAEGFTVEV